MTVEKLMIKNPLTISPFASVRDALNIMKENDVKSLVVEKKADDDAYGLVTYTAILKAIVAEDGDIDLLNVYDVYAKPALTVSKQLNVKYVARLMADHNVKRVLIADNNELEGIVTMTDIIENLMETHQL